MVKRDDMSMGMALESGWAIAGAVPFATLVIFSEPRSPESAFWIAEDARMSAIGA